MSFANDEMVENLCFISLGSDCSVSYQLRKLGLQTHGSMPFDWMRIDNLLSVISILKDEFRDFARFESYIIKQQSLAFDYFGTSGASGAGSASQKSECRMVHSRYKFILPHEYQGTQIDPTNFAEKYSRRIARFLEIGRNEKIRKIFVRLGTKKEETYSTNLHNALDSLGIVNYTIKYIIYNEWDELIPQGVPFQWQRDYMPWKEILMAH